MGHDPIATPTIPIADHREPRFVFAEDEETASAKLAAYRQQRGRQPNVLVRSYMIRKLAYQQALIGGVSSHLATYGKYPARRVIGPSA